MEAEAKLVELTVKAMLLSNAVVLVWDWDAVGQKACECCGGTERQWQHAFGYN